MAVSSEHAQGAQEVCVTQFEQVGFGPRLGHQGPEVFHAGGADEFPPLAGNGLGGEFKSGFVADGIHFGNGQAAQVFADADEIFSVAGVEHVAARAGGNLNDNDIAARRDEVFNIDVDLRGIANTAADLLNGVGRERGDGLNFAR